MVWIAGSSRAGYDYPGPFERTVVLVIDSPEVFQGRQAHPGGLVCPFVPLEAIREGNLDVEVRTQW